MPAALTAKIELLDPPHPEVPAPHAKFGPDTIALPPAVAGASGATATLPGPPPLADSSTIEVPAAGSRAVILPIAGSTTAWRPVYEVANFAWPDSTAALLQRAAQQFRTAANELGEAGKRHRKLVAVTAARRGEGCTFVSLALAKAIADLQQKVILVDAHFDAPLVAESLGIVAQVGWEDHLGGEKPLVEALVESLEDGLTVLPLRDIATGGLPLEFYAAQGVVRRAAAAL